MFALQSDTDANSESRTVHDKETTKRWQSFTNLAVSYLLNIWDINQCLCRHPLQEICNNKIHIWGDMLDLECISTLITRNSHWDAKIRVWFQSFLPVMCIKSILMSNLEVWYLPPYFLQTFLRCWSRNIMYGTCLGFKLS